MPVTVYNNQRKVAVDTDLLCQTFERALQAAGLADRDVEVTFVSNRVMTTLNRQWRGKSGPTDCLSFPFGDGMPALSGMPVMPLGEIVISIQQAAIQGPLHFESEVAPESAVFAETVFLFIHSLLHLAGFDHETGDADAERMRIEERRIFQAIGMDC